MVLNGCEKLQMECVVGNLCSDSYCTKLKVEKFVALNIYACCSYHTRCHYNQSVEDLIMYRFPTTDKFVSGLLAFIGAVYGIQYWLCRMYITHDFIIQMCSGKTRGRVLNRELYAQRFQKLIYQHSFTDCFMKIAPQS